MKSKKKYKFLYRYNCHHELEKHEFKDGCDVMPTDPLLRPGLFSCYEPYDGNGNMHSHFHGYFTLKEARADERIALREDIANLKEKLKKLG